MDRREFLIDLMAISILNKSDDSVVAGQGSVHPGTEAGLPFQVEREPVRGIPLIADVEESGNITLPDGRHIRHRSSGTFYRDSAGRLRIEQTHSQEIESAVKSDEATQIMIIDPTLAQAYSLRVNERMAISYTGQPSTSRDVPESARKLFNELSTSKQVTKLGTKLVEGFECEGQRVTSTISAGLVANIDRPMVIEAEDWIAQELHLILQHVQRTNFGSEHTKHLSNIRRVEPDAELFRVPDGYSVTEGNPPTGVSTDQHI